MQTSNGAPMFRLQNIISCEISFILGTFQDPNEPNFGSEVYRSTFADYQHYLHYAIGLASWDGLHDTAFAMLAESLTVTLTL